MISGKEAKKLKDRIKELEKEVKHLKKIEKEFEEFKAEHNITVDNLRKAMNLKPNSKIEPKPLGAPRGISLTHGTYQKELIISNHISQKDALIATHP